MKKIILGFIALFIFSLSVVAADNTNEEIVLKEIKITNYELAPFDGKIEVNFELVPNDVENKEVVWSISGLQKGVTAEFDGEYKTNVAVGTIVLTIKNTNEDMSTLKLNAKSGNISKTVSVKVEDQVATEDRYKKEVVEEIEKLIKEVKTIDTKNEEEVEKAIEKIETMLDNEEVKKSVDKKLLEDFDEVKEKFEAYNNEDDKNYAKTIVIVALALAFLFGLYMIFKDTSKAPKKEIKKETKKPTQKSTQKPKSKKK